MAKAHMFKIEDRGVRRPLADAAVSRLDAQTTGVVQPFASEGGPSEFCEGTTDH